MTPIRKKSRATIGPLEGLRRGPRTSPVRGKRSFGSGLNFGGAEAMKKSGGLGLLIILLGITLLTYGEVRGESLSWEGALEVKLPETQALVNLGKQVFNTACFYCHGEEGKGNGKARRYLFLMPRDFTSGKFKVRSTPTGSLPTDEDLFRTITVGLPEYRMPRFKYLSAKERWALVYYIKTFFPPFKESKPEPITLGEAPPVTAEMLAQGRELFHQAECWKCHGKQGKGDGPSAPDLKDDWDNPIRLLDWTQGERVFKRGAGARDVLHTMLTGFTGTPMPSYEGVFTDEQAWALASYVQEIVKKGKPE